MNVTALLIFLLIFLGVTMGVPFILVTILPTVNAMLGSFGVSLVTGIILYFLLVKMSGAKA